MKSLGRKTSKMKKIPWEILLGVAIFMVFSYFFSGILFPFMAAFILAYVLNPGVERLESLGCPRVVLALISVLILLLAIGGLLFGVVPFLKDQLIYLVKNFPSYTHRIYQILMPHFEKFSQWEGGVDFQSKLSTYVGDIVSWGIKIILNILTGSFVLANILSLVVITPILVFYLLRDWKILLKHIEHNLPRSYRQTVLSLARDMNRALGGYVRGQSLVCLCLAIVYGAGLSLVGLEHGIIIGGISGVLAFVPYIGFIISFTVALGIALAQFSQLQSVGMVIGVYALGQILEATIFTPKLVGDRIGVHPVWIIFTLLAGGSVFGFFGVLFALPMAAIVAVGVRAVMGYYRKSAYYNGEDSTKKIPTKDIPQESFQSTGAPS